MTRFGKWVIGLALLVLLSMVAMVISLAFVPDTKSDYMNFMTAKKEIKKTSPGHWRFENMKPSDLESATSLSVNEFASPVAWLVVSPIEWHGEAMSFGTDPIIGGTVAERAWEKVGGVLFPTLYLGTGSNYALYREGKSPLMQFELENIIKEPLPGSLYVTPQTLEMVLRDYLYFLERAGFQLCVIVSGHGAIENTKIINNVVDSVNAAYDANKGTLMACFNFSINSDLQSKEDLSFPGSGGHADMAEASRLGGIYPEMVDKSKFGNIKRDRAISLLKENVSKIDFGKGAKSVEFSAERLADGVTALLEELGLNSLYTRK